MDRIIWGEFNKIDFENRIIEGCFTSEAVDSDNDIVDYDATKEAVAEWDKWRNIREMHLPVAVGVAVDITLDDNERKGYLRAKIVDDQAWKKVVEGVYKGFSIGAKVLKAAYKNGIRRWLKYRLMEVSLADRPKNPDALFSVAKCEYTEEVLKVEDLEGKVSIRRREDVSDADIQRAIEEYGDLPDSQWGDPTNKKYPLDTEKHVRAAWAYINMPRNQRGYSEAEVNTIKERIRRAGKKFGIEFSEEKAEDVHGFMQDLMVACGCEQCVKMMSMMDTMDEEGHMDEGKAQDDMAYCMICKKKMQMESPETVEINGRKALRGKCSEGHTMYKFIPSDESKPEGDQPEQKADEITGEKTETKQDAGCETEDQGTEQKSDPQNDLDILALKAQVAEELKAALGGLLEEKVAPLTEGFGKVASSVEQIGSAVEELRGRVEKLEAQPEQYGPVFKSAAQVPAELAMLDALKAAFNSEGDPRVREALGKRIAFMETKLIQGGIRQ